MKNAWCKAAALFMAALLFSGFDTSAAPMLVTVTDMQHQAHVYRYDVEEKQTSLLERRDRSSCVTAAATKDGTTVYCASGDALFQWNAQTKESKQLAGGLPGVDLLRLDEKGGKLYMRAAVKGHSNLHIAAYDLKTGKTEVWDAGETDKSVRWFDLDPASGRLLALVYSQSEEAKKSDAAREDGLPADPAAHRLLLYDTLGRQHREAGVINGLHALDVSLSADGQHALFSAVDRLEEGAPSTVYHMDLNNGHVTPVFTERDGFKRLRQPQFAPQGTGIYVIANNAVCCYDFKTKQISEAWAKKDGIVADYQFLR